MAEKHFKSGFAVLAGLPNAGKSTLLNKLAGGLLSPVTSKPQTTRQNILAISEGDNYQVVFVDTPGFLQPRYKLQQTMVNAVDRAVGEEADLVVFMLDAAAPYDLNAGLVEKLKQVFCPIFLVINKTDLVPDAARLKELEDAARKDLPVSRAFCISAAQGKGVDELKQAIIEAMPVSPAYFPPGQWTDRWERFYAAEFIREQIFLLYKKEIPYSTYVEVEKFTEDLGDKNSRGAGKPKAHYYRQRRRGDCAASQECAKTHRGIFRPQVPPGTDRHRYAGLAQQYANAGAFWLYRKIIFPDAKAPPQNGGVFCFQNGCFIGEFFRRPKSLLILRRAACGRNVLCC